MSKTPSESYSQETTQSTLGSAVTTRRGELAVSASAARAKAEVEARFVIALNRPRNHFEVRRRILEACQRPGFAEGAIYAKPVGGNNTVDGFSIRFAEEAVKCMGNITVESPVIWEDDEKRTVRIAVTDLESNTSYSKDVNLSKTVERRNVRPGQNVLGERKNSVGQTVFLVEASEDELTTKVAAAESKVIRNAALRLIPSDVLDEAWDLLLKTRNNGGSDPQADVKKLVDAFTSLNVSPVQVERYLGHSLETVSKKELAGLRSVFTAIRDGEASWSDYVSSAPPPTEAEALSDIPRAKTPKQVKTEPVAAKAPSRIPAQSTPAEKLAQLREKIAGSGIDESALVAALSELGILDGGLTLDEALEVSPSAISAALSGFSSLVKSINEAKTA